MKCMRHQQERFESFLKREISGFLQQNLPRESGVFVSVAKVISGEKSDKAEVFITVFPENHAKEIFVQIKRAENSVRKYISSRSSRQFIPKITFKMSGQATSERLEKLLEKVKNE